MSQAKLTRSKSIRAVLILFVILFSAYAFFWYWSALKIVASLDQELTNLKQSGWDIRYESQQTMGFPTRLKLKLNKVVAYSTAAEEETPLFVADRVSIVSKMVNPITYLSRIAMAGEEGTQIELSDLGRLTVAAKDIQFAEGSMFPLADKMDNFEIQMTAYGPYALTGDKDARLQYWQQSGGYLDIHLAALKWDKVFIDSNGRLQLDERYQLVGTLDANTTGLPEFLSGLGQQGVLDQGVADIAAASIGFFSVPVENTLNGEIREFFTVPMSFEKGGFYIGPLKLKHMGSLIEE